MEPGLWITNNSQLTTNNSQSRIKDCDVSQIGVGAEIKIDSLTIAYIRAGLPPHPISNPGLMSIEAALNPTGNYFYYLSTRDGSQIIFFPRLAPNTPPIVANIWDYNIPLLYRF